MENKGIVQKVNNNSITVKLFKDSSCSHCNQCHGASKYGKDFEFTTDKEIHVGDLVTLEISEKEVIKAAAIAYVFPPFMMILGYLVADHLGFSENQSIVSSFFFLALSFLCLFFYDKSFAKKKVEEEIRIVSVETYNPDSIESSNHNSCSF